MTIEKLFDKYSENWGNGEPLMNKEFFIKATAKLAIQNNKLIELCGEYFNKSSCYVQEYAGAPYECLFCGKYLNKPHKEDCPVEKYAKIISTT